MKNGEALWTLDDLAREVEAALAEGYEGAASGRVRDIPDRRTIRYYTTLGLIDRPTAMRGRTALYGRRHLLQLVAIKKLQASGQALADIQAALTGQTDLALARIAGQETSMQSSPVNSESPPARRDFWREEPAAHATPSEDTVEEATPHATEMPPDRARVLSGIPIHPGVTLLVATSRPFSGEDLEAVRSAALPLMDYLIRSRLIESRERGDPQ